MTLENDPSVAEGMNSADKTVFFKTLTKAEWNNTRLIKDHIEEEIKTLKHNSQKDMPLLGSGSIVSQFAEKSMIDEYQVMIDPVVIGSENSIFKGIVHQLNLKLINTKTTESDVVLLCYQPVKN